MAGITHERTEAMEGSASLALACRVAAAAARASTAEPRSTAEQAIATLQERLPGTLVALFVLEHDRLWLGAQRGYTMIPEGLSTSEGVIGRAVRSGRTQVVADVAADPDYIAIGREVSSELAVPLRSDGKVVGVLNVETTWQLPPDAARVVRPLAAALAPVVDALRAGRTLDLSALARLFVHISSLRGADRIAEVAASSLGRVLPVETSQVSLVGDEGELTELGAWQTAPTGPEPLTREELEALRPRVEPTAVFDLLELEHEGQPRSVIWLPLRASGGEIGALVGTSRWARDVDAGRAEVAALLAAHVAASLDAALALERERRSASTDALTGLLNRRGFEELLDGEIARAQEARQPLSLLVLDCDDFKLVNDRVGFEMGDAVLKETAHALAVGLPEGGTAGRLGGDEFVVVLPCTDGQRAEVAGNEVRRAVAQALTDAGFPLRLSVGVATYPFDGGSTSQLKRAADQALHRAKETGKDRVVGFRDAMAGARPQPGRVGGDRRRMPGPADAAVLARIAEAAAAIWAEPTVEQVLERTCKALTFIVGGTGAVASRVDGPLLVEVTRHALRDVELGAEEAYRIADFPLSERVLRTGEPCGLSFLDDEVDPAEAFVLRELRMNSLLLVPLPVHGRAWGLVELYDVRLRHFGDADLAVGRFVVAEAGRRIETLAGAGGAIRRRLPVYELPASASSEPSARRSR